MKTTTPAPSDSAVHIPPSVRISPLALAALENGVAADDVRAYLEARNSGSGK